MRKKTMNISILSCSLSRTWVSTRFPRLKCCKSWKSIITKDLWCLTFNTITSFNSSRDFQIAWKTRTSSITFITILKVPLSTINDWRSTRGWRGQRDKYDLIFLYFIYSIYFGAISLPIYLLSIFFEANNCFYNINYQIIISILDEL